MFNRFKAAFGVMPLVAVLPMAAEAAPVTLCGPTVCYEYNDDATVNTGLASLGAPTLLAGSDVLLFTPTAYLAMGGGGSSQTSTATFLFDRVYAAQPGFEIASISLREGGDYRVINGGAVNANLRLQAIDRVDDSGSVLFPEVAVDTQNFFTSVPTGFQMQEWSLTSTLSPAALFADLAGDLSVQIQNSLDAFTFGSSEFTFIQKKYMILDVTTQVVPVPAAAWLLGSALGLIGVRRFRQAATA